MSLVSRDIKLLSGVWRQVKCENVWRYNLAIGAKMFIPCKSEFIFRTRLVLGSHFSFLCTNNEVQFSRRRKFPRSDSHWNRMVMVSRSKNNTNVWPQRSQRPRLSDDYWPYVQVTISNIQQSLASWSTEKKRKDSSATPGSLKTITQNVLLDEANETIVSYAVGHRKGLDSKP